MVRCVSPCCFCAIPMLTVFRFSSNLPGGSPAGRRGGSKGGGYCILDCVFHELDQTFFVLDMMAWKVSRCGHLFATTFMCDRAISVLVASLCDCL